MEETQSHMTEGTGQGIEESPHTQRAQVKTLSSASQVGKDRVPRSQRQS